MERGPEFRIVGNAPEENKEKVKTEIGRNLFHHFESLPKEIAERLKESELPKTREERLLLNFANAETNRILLYFGLKPYNIPEENYHLLPAEIYRDFTKSSPSSIGTAHFYEQGIGLNGDHLRKGLTIFGEVSIHETLHLKSHFGLEVEKKEEKIQTSHYRQGISVRASQKERSEGRFHEHFLGLHEAIISEQTKKSFRRMLELPILKKEKEYMQSEETIKTLKKISEQTGKSIDEFCHLDRDGKIFELPYPEQRKVLNYICEEIQQELPEEYKNKDAVFSIFLGGQLTGRLLPIARLVEHVFGKGSFRILGNMTLEKESTALVLDTLRKMRSKNKNG